MNTTYFAVLDYLNRLNMQKQALKDAGAPRGELIAVKEGQP